MTSASLEGLKNRTAKTPRTPRQEREKDQKEAKEKYYGSGGEFFSSLHSLVSLASRRFILLHLLYRFGLECFRWTSVPNVELIGGACSQVVNERYSSFRSPRT